jgi:hypothetical protein
MKIIYSPFHILHVSASIDHPQVNDTQPLLKAVMPTSDPFLGYTVYYFILCYVIRFRKSRLRP